MIAAKIPFCPGAGSRLPETVGPGCPETPGRKAKAKRIGQFRRKLLQEIGSQPGVLASVEHSILSLAFLQRKDILVSFRKNPNEKN
jgi:hypothetical protein